MELFDYALQGTLVVGYPCEDDLIYTTLSVFQYKMKVVDIQK